MVSRPPLKLWEGDPIDAPSSTPTATSAIERLTAWAKEKLRHLSVPPEPEEPGSILPFPNRNESSDDPAEPRPQLRLVSYTEKLDGPDEDEIIDYTE